MEKEKENKKEKIKIVIETIIAIILVIYATKEVIMWLAHIHHQYYFYYSDEYIKDTKPLGETINDNEK